MAANGYFEDRKRRLRLHLQKTADRVCVQYHDEAHYSAGSMSEEERNHWYTLGSGLQYAGGHIDE